VENVVANHLSRINHGQDDKEPIGDKMKDDHLYWIINKDTWMINIIRTIWKMPLDHLDKNAQRRVTSKSRKYYWDSPYLFRLGTERREARDFKKVSFSGIQWTLWALSNTSKGVVQRILLARDA
jgi:hypothetical protein